MDAAERALLTESVRDALARAAASGGDASGADAALAELGWLDMLEAAPSDAIEVVFHALGATNATATALDDVVVAALGVRPRPDLAIVLPPFAGAGAPARIDHSHVCAAGLATARVATAAEVVLVDGGTNRLGATVVPTTAVHAVSVHGIDPDFALYSVRIDGHPTGPMLETTGSWEAAVALARRALGHQIAGATRVMLDLARAHALERVQFERPIARFQAVRHRLADAFVAVEALDAALGAAADEPGATTAALAKAVAGRTARTTAMHCQQVLAGIGFTTDHPFHRYLKRTMVLDGLFGNADAIVVDLGRGLLARRAVPTLIEL